MELIKMENIKARERAKDWEESIEKAGEILLKQGKITEQYIQNMIHVVKEYGPYMVLMPGFALAHAEPSEAVIETSISLMTLQEPVDFKSTNGPVSVLMCLACRDKTEHINMLQLIAEKLMDEGMIERLTQCKDETEIYQLMN